VVPVWIRSRLASAAPQVTPHRQQSALFENAARTSTAPGRHPGWTMGPPQRSLTTCDPERETAVRAGSNADIAALQFRAGSNADIAALQVARIQSNATTTA
jgi:hypothetical protein